MLHHQTQPFVEHVHDERSAHRQLPADAAELERLVRRAVARDERAWETLFERFNTRVRAAARAHRLSPHDAEDVVQTTWLRLLTHIGRVREPASVGAYLHTTARHESLRTVASGRREQPADVDWEAEAAARDDEPDARLLDAERHAALASALETLPARHRRLMELLIAEPALSYAEIAAALEMPIGSIGPIRARCLARLAQDAQLVLVIADEAA
jgi:RNA polymerase sigma factor (sigma-70 family)